MCKIAKNSKHSTIIGWVVIVVERELGCGVLTMNDQDKLARYFYEWQHNKNPVTRASYRNIALKLYFELYIF